MPVKRVVPQRVTGFEAIDKPIGVKGGDVGWAAGGEDEGGRGDRFINVGFEIFDGHLIQIELALNHLQIDVFALEFFL